MSREPGPARRGWRPGRRTGPTLGRRSTSGGSLSAVGPVPEVHGVEVLGQDLLLRVAMTDLDREHRLFDLSGEGLLVGQVDRPDVLLGDRRATLDEPSMGDVRPRGAQDRGRRDAALTIEVVVLDGDDRVLEVDGDLIEGHFGPVDLGVQRRDDVAVAIVDVRGLRARGGYRDLQVLVDVIEGPGDAGDDDQGYDERRPTRSGERSPSSSVAGGAAPRRTVRFSAHGACPSWVWFERPRRWMLPDRYCGHVRTTWKVGDGTARRLARVLSPPTG